MATFSLKNERVRPSFSLFLVKQKLFTKYTDLYPCSLEVGRVFVVRLICGQTRALTFYYRISHFKLSESWFPNL